MKKTISYLMSMLLVGMAICPSFAFAADQEKDTNRLENSGTVLKEILGVPDDIPQDLLDKADCVVVFPSVLKAAFIVGGSYGRGAMSCRRGENFRGPWGPPSMMALEGGVHDGSGGRQFWLPNRGRGDRLCAADNERAWCEWNSLEQSQAWCGCV